MKEDMKIYMDNLFFREIGLNKNDEEELRELEKDGQLVGLVDEDAGVVGYLHGVYADKILTILNLWMTEHYPKRGEQIYAGNIGEVIVTNNHTDTEVFLVYEEDDTVSWQLVPEDSDIVLTSVYVQEIRACGNCYGKMAASKLVEITKDKYGISIYVCSSCKEKVDKGELVYLDEECPVCKLHWHGFHSPESGLKNHDDWECRKVQTNTINPDKPYGQHIELKCSKCGCTGWSTKNIDYVGARSIFFDLHHEGLKECDCNVPLIPVRESKEIK